MTSSVPMSTLEISIGTKPCDEFLSTVGPEELSFRMIGNTPPLSVSVKLVSDLLKPSVFTLARL
ncbi:protein of unknown function [Candidatus Nitrospira inopinata]|uniref:Uncharacterized protein n=1 Tax=Candidatus Nitrospira inopinata TaxID=1715989 RepID=A0A0S4KTX2_9BACT|nr:protein of unknown function [Candidatus Nitrospira inopinata]